jgi:hypothetical protein
MKFKSTNHFVAYLFEQTESPSETTTKDEGGGGKTTLSVAKELVSKNKFLSDKAASMTEENLIDMDKYVFIKFPDTFDHTKRHFSGTEESDKIPGSKFLPKFSNENGLIELMKKIVSKPPTVEGVKEGPTTKDKWLNYDVGEIVGKDSVGKLTDYPNATPADTEANEPIGRNVAIPAIISGGNRVMKLAQDGSLTPVTQEQAAEAAQDTQGKYVIAQNVKTIDAPKKDTTEVTLVLADLGENTIKTPDGKKVVTLVTFFPGHEYGYKSKEEYSKNGYVFLSGKGSLTESKIRAELFPEVRVGFDVGRWQRMAGLILKG